ncbi:MAG TPA: DUF2510 domain-containing protein [Pseudolysinimonas sp.]|jgi:hypothetical protein|nr:DUF2510 domain-containing protein [Pseudolysinimonas sp.]
MTAPAAGWYRDPADSGAWRWWDGASWTEHLRAVETPEQTGPVQLTPPQTAPVQVAPVPATPQGEPVQGEPVQAAPVETTPVQTAPAETAPPQHEPGQPEPVQHEPMQSAQVVIEPVPTHRPVFDQFVPASSPAPVAAPPQPAPPAPPAPVVADGIPVPGQTAPPPEVRFGSVSLTPAIPVTDQMYWHSAAAEKIEVPRLTHTESIRAQRANAAPTFVRDWNDLGSPQTTGVWLLALSPLLYLVVAFLLGVVQGLSGGAFGPYLLLVVAAVATGLNWIFAYTDQRQLRERGYHPAPLGWMLLFPPIAYLIARGRVVRREGMSAWPPELVYVLAFGALVGINVLSRLGVLSLGIGG